MSVSVAHRLVPQPVFEPERRDDSNDMMENNMALEIRWPFTLRVSNGIVAASAMHEARPPAKNTFIASDYTGNEMISRTAISISI